MGDIFIFYVVIALIHYGKIWGKKRLLIKPLTDREFEILRLIVLGKNNKEIANELFISVHTAKAHVSSILEKFSVEDRVKVAVMAVREGLV